MNVLNEKLTVNSLLGWLVLIGLLGSIVMPNVSVGGVSLYITTPMSVIVFVLVFYLTLTKAKINVDSSVFILLALCLVVVFSAVISWIKNLTPVSYRDLIEVVKYAQYIPYLMAIPFLKKDFLGSFEFFSKVAVILFLLVGFLQVFQIHILTHLYLDSQSSHLDSVLKGDRLTITGSDPNIGGAIAAFFAFMSLSFYLLRRKRIFWLFAFIICFVLLLFTQSRTVLVAFLFSFVVFFLFFYKLSLIVKIPFFIILLGTGFLIFMSLNLDYIVIGFQIVLQGESNSLNVRLENLASAYELFRSNPILGVGPSKESLTSTVDSEYALIMQRYGLIGILVFLYLIVFLFRTALDNLKFINANILLLFMMMVPFIMFTNNVFSGYQLMSIPIALYILIKVQRKVNEF